MDGTRNITIQYHDKRYHILYVGIHGGSGMGASEPYNGRYYLVLPDLWKKEKDSYCMVHDSRLPGAWAYYEKDGICLVEENQYPGRVTPEVLMETLSRLEPDILAVCAGEELP